MYVYKSTFLIFIFFSLISFGQELEIPKADKRVNSNALNIHLAATKLCMDYYDSHNVLDERRNKSSYRGHDGQNHYTCHICASSVHEHFTSPFEYFVDHYLNDTRLKRNRTNAFTVKAIREDINLKYADGYQNLIEEIDTENLIFYQTDLIQGYSMEEDYLAISMQTPHFKNNIPNTDRVKSIYIPLLKGFGVNENGQRVGNAMGEIAYFKVPMEERRAEEIFENYASHFNPNPPFKIATKLHYALRLSEEFEGKPRYFQVILKKVEFFISPIEHLKRIQYDIIEEVYDTDNKIAEVTFGDNLKYTDNGYAYQEILRIE